MKTHWRAVDVFTNAANLTLEDCRVIGAEQSAAGRLQSGETAKRAIDAFARRSLDALKQVHQEVANKVEHRGRKWRAAMSDVQRALEEHFARAPEVLEPTLRLANAERGEARAAVDQVIGWAKSDQIKEHKAFADGWTAPRPKRWQERNPIVYAVLMIMVGAAIGQAASPAWRALTATMSGPSGASKPATDIPVRP